MSILGFKFRNKRIFSFTWGEVSFGRFGLALSYQAGEHNNGQKALVHLHFLLINIFLYMPWNHYGDWGCFEEPQWGFSYHDQSLVLNFGKHNKYISMPWAWNHIRHDILMADGSWKRVGRCDGPWNWKYKWLFTYPYKYTLRSGEMQGRTATIGVEEREWRRLWLSWIPFFGKVRRVISIEFNEEIGERTGSWKGGTVGCSYDILKDETPLECLKRMEREREFT